MNLRILFFVAMLGLLQCKSAKPTTDSSPATLLNTHWRLAEMNGEPVLTSAGQRDVHIILTQADGEDRISGYAGCNNIGGTFKRNGDKISFSAFTTRMMCPPEQMKVEDFLLKALTATDNYEISGETLTLMEGEIVVGKFSSKN